jgi:hypothetical protein
MVFMYLQSDCSIWSIESILHDRSLGSEDLLYHTFLEGYQTQVRLGTRHPSLEPWRVLQFGAQLSRPGREGGGA